MDRDQCKKTRRAGRTRCQAAVLLAYTLVAAPVYGQVEQGTVAEASVSAWVFALLVAAAFVLGFAVTFAYVIGTFSVKTLQSTGSPKEVIERTSRCDQNKGGKRILVTYDTRHGSAALAAERLTQVFASRGFDVDLRLVRNIDGADISHYDAIIVGSCIYWGKMSVPTVDFLRQHRRLLAGKPVAYFVVCGRLGRVAIGHDETVLRKAVRHYLDPVFAEMPEINPFDVGKFAGRVDFGKMSGSEWIIMKLYFQMHMGMKGGDYMDMQKITAWAQKTCDALSGVPREKKASA